MKMSGRQSITETRVLAQNGDCIVHQQPPKPQTIIRKQRVPGQIADLNPVRPDDPPEYDAKRPSHAARGIPRADEIIVTPE